MNTVLVSEASEKIAGELYDEILGMMEDCTQREIVIKLIALRLDQSWLAGKRESEPSGKITKLKRKRK